MRITLAAVGRFRRDSLRSLYDDYAARIAWSLEVKEVVARKPVEGEALKAEEGELLLAAVPGGATLVALDAGGKTLSSEAFAERLRAWRDTGVQDLAFVVGGADGLADDVLRRADLKLSLGAMTWPHMLVRVLLAEQLYRAQAILSGHPYHR
ncbi:23S rRNA (pseudouridine(1915)-N(3))-methyltransferase RlmH [Ferruginivarius sediminum]|uniref:Ribosomal RNA large subunit methyltransferase H n=1 Tax=Ferruginivarius sediminum TaxID=2661937 RepID=A0A369T890_9PROT|nr:23S rRNA (pseudouridine(1915)-N(3))-methyltransferase RlmH [Ferruginivarius sediminum]RDD61112.1 23S rRNA (pseudouridine(1915)-N(3))-methyltransferase RlmH [Ferruginivarius sediminum]